MECRSSGLRFRMQRLGFGVSDLGFRVPVFFGFKNLGLRMYGLQLKVKNELLELSVQGLRL